MVLATKGANVVGCSTDEWLIKDGEGMKGQFKVDGEFRYKSYKDSKGYPTICYGALLSANRDYIDAQDDLDYDKVVAGKQSLSQE